MPENIIKCILEGKVSNEILIKWLHDELIEDKPEYAVLLCCHKSDFVAYFISLLRSQTDSILQTNTTAFNLIQHQATPEKLLNTRRKHHRSISDPTNQSGEEKPNNLSVETDRHRSHESPNREKSKKTRRIKTKLFNESDKSKDQSSSLMSSRTDSDDSKINSGVESLVISSTPLKNGVKANDYPNFPMNSPVTPQSRSFGTYERCDTPRISSRHSKSQDKANFGDYLVNAQAAKSSKKKRLTPKNISNELSSDKSVNLDLSNSDIFPAIGARKSSSLKSEKRRIKPTNIDITPQKSFSLNSFNSESFQQPSHLALEGNIAFKHIKQQPKELSASFEAERSILKQERHKLMEKFNILNTSTPKTPTTPTIKIMQKEFNEKQQSFVEADATKINFKDKLDILIEIYEVLLCKNLILSLSSEIYFLISIILSQQYEDDYLTSELKLAENVTENILKTIHNSMYFAVKSLWHQKHILEFMLDKNSLKILGEHKKVRGFCPDLAKFLLNLYGMRNESDINREDKPIVILEQRYPNGVVCFNFETDNADNFPSLLSFQNFKKQRDMFYEILRWYTENHQNNATKSTFRTRVKTLLSLAVSPANHSHLARLYTSHMISECLPSMQQESKLSKLNRRLTGPASHESHRLPRFTAKEMFYKEFVMFAENESFRIHLKDSISTEICLLNSISLSNIDEKANSNLSKEYVHVLKKSRLLSKFLGFLSSLPYTQVPTDFVIKTNSLKCFTDKEQTFSAPKERVLESGIAIRNYSQPTIDLKSILISSNENNRLSITIPWIVNYLSMLDYTSLRTEYYQKILKILFEIYKKKLIFNKNVIKNDTIVFLKLTLGWLFDLSHFPQEIFYEENIHKMADYKMADSKMADSKMADDSVDMLDLVDVNDLFDLCPFLKDVNVLLITSKPTQERDNSFRHITPITMSLNAEDRIKNKEKEIQARLEEEFLKSQPSSTRRLLELIISQISSSTVKYLNTNQIREARKRCRKEAFNIIKQYNENDLLQKISEIYNKELKNLRTESIEMIHDIIVNKTNMALKALLAGGSKKALESIVIKSCQSKVQKWIYEHWDSTDILCKDIKDEIKNLMYLGDSISDEQTNIHNVKSITLPQKEFDQINISPSAVVIELKDQICLLLDYEETTDIVKVLKDCQSVCQSDNIFMRPPAKRALLQLTQDLCIVYVSRKPKELTEELLNYFHKVWNECCPDRKRNEEKNEETETIDYRDFHDSRAPTPISDEDTEKPMVIDSLNITNNSNLHVKVITPTKVINTSTKVINTPTTVTNTPIIVTNTPVKVTNTPIIVTNTPVKVTNTPNKVLNSEKKVQISQEDDLLCFFDRIMCSRNIVIMSNSKCKQSEVWEAMANVLVFLLKNFYLSEDSLTEQCLAVYRQDWPQNTLENLSSCMKIVSNRWSRSSSGKFTLFLDFLSEFCGDMDYSSFE